MKLKLKNLKQQEFDIEIESDKKTIKDLKLEIEKANGFDANLIKLLHSGQILDDVKTLEDYKIKEGNVIIMMATKKKQVEQPPQPVPNPNPQPNSQPNPQPQEQPKTNENKPDYSDKVNSLVDMGYEKEKAEKAIAAAQGSIDLAVEFLNSGNIPEPGANTGNVNIPSSGSSNSNLPDELKKNASIIKILCMNNPEKITSLLNIFKERHPNLINLIKLHEAEFKNLLVSPISQEDINNFQEIQQELRRPQGPSIRLTKEESDAVKRLQELGFSQAEAVQAYIACDKNEEMAANFLFEQKMREEEEENRNNPNQGQGQGQG